MNENFNNQCRPQCDQEIGCGCSGVLEYFHRLINDVERLANESKELFERTDNLLAKSEYTVDEGQRNLASASVRFNAAIAYLSSAPNSSCLCEGTNCPTEDITSLITSIQTSLTGIEATLTSIEPTIDATLAQYEQLVLALEQFEQCIRCGSCKSCCNCSSRITCNCPRI